MESSFIALILGFLLFQNPTLQISDNGRYIETSEGNPFLWIGDTAWDLFHDLDRDEATYYLENRADKKFTLIQAVVLSENDGIRTPNAYGDLPFFDFDPTQPNENYFEHVDFIVDKAEQLGLYIGMLPTWGDKVFSNNPGAGPIIFNKENAFIYGEFLGKRYKDKPIIWILGGDRNPANKEVEQTWEAMAMGLRKGDDGHHLITYHPRGASSSSTYLHDKEWLDFNMYQSGHSRRFESVYRYAENDRAKDPIKPTIEGESGYEDIGIEFWKYIDFSKPPKERVPKGSLDENNLIKDGSFFKKGLITAHDVRVFAYWNFLSGAAGYTYGNNAVWQMFEKGGDLVIPALFDWKESLDRPGADDMRHVNTLFSKRPFHLLIPDQTLILGKNPKDSTYVVAAQASDHSFSLFYASVGQPIIVDMTKLNDLTEAIWFNPRDGSTTRDSVSTFGVSSITFLPPTSGIDNDWVLVLDDPSKKFSDF